jgi:riboflavin biosynthesis pyrimidine reductase
VRQLLPVAADVVDPAVVYADLPEVAGRPGVRLNMIASLDGAATVDGLSGGLGGPADRRVFAALRELAEVVLVAAGTVRAERYGPSKVPLAIVTRSCALDLGSPLFVEGARAIVLTVATAPPKAVAAAREVADVLVAGEQTVDPITTDRFARHLPATHHPARRARAHPGRPQPDSGAPGCRL